MSEAPSKSSKARPTSTRWLIVSITGLVSIIAGLERADISILAKPLIDGHYTTREILGLANSLFVVVFALSNGLGGLMVDRLGGKRIMTAAVTWWGAITALTAFFFSGFAIVPLRILLGLGEGLQGPTCSKWVKEWFPTRERAISSTIQNAGLWVGPLISGPLVTWLYLSTNSVFAPWLILGFGTIIIAVPIIVFLGGDRPEEHRLTNKAEVELIREGQNVERKLQIPAGQVLRDYHYWIVVFAWCGMATIFIGLTFWLPLYMENERHLSVEATGIWYALPYFIMLIFAVIFSLLSDRILRRAPFIVGGLVLAAVLLLVATNVTSVTLALLLISFGLGCNGIVQPNIAASLQQFAQRSNIGVVYGVALAAQSLAAALGTYIIGVSFTVGFIYLATFATLGGLATVVLVIEGL